MKTEKLKTQFIKMNTPVNDNKMYSESSKRNIKSSFPK